VLQVQNTVEDMLAYAGLAETALRLVNNAYQSYFAIACLDNSTWRFDTLE
jgi:hypothetical protein